MYHYTCYLYSTLTLHQSCPDYLSMHMSMTRRVTTLSGACMGRSNGHIWQCLTECSVLKRLNSFEVSLASVIKANKYKMPDAHEVNSLEDSFMYEWNSCSGNGCEHLSSVFVILCTFDFEGMHACNDISQTVLPPNRAINIILRMYSVGYCSALFEITSDSLFWKPWVKQYQRLLSKERQRQNSLGIITCLYIVTIISCLS